MPSCRTHRLAQHLVPAEVFCTSLSINARNQRLSDADFRRFVVNSLPAVAFQGPAVELEPRQENRTNAGTTGTL